MPVTIFNSLIGAYATDGSMFDVSVALAFGLLTLILRIFDYPIIPLFLGLILGPLAENNFVLSLAMSLLYFRWVRDSQSGMWVFRRSILDHFRLESDGMAFSEEIKIEALRNSNVRFAELSILYTSRLGEIKLNPWRDGFFNLYFLLKKRFSARRR